MTWNFDRSLERARRKYEEASDVEVTKLTREMDFQNISLKKAKRVHGAHLYTDLPNFGAIVKNAFGGDEAELLRRLHILNRELTRGVEKDLPAAKVHFQGPRLHAVAYRPIDNDTEIAVLAVIAACAARSVVLDLFNPLFEGNRFEFAAGIDIGDAVATMNNVRGDRELLFLGSPANRAAKILDEGVSITPAVADALPTEWAQYVIDRGGDEYSIDLPADVVVDTVQDRGWAWSLEQSKERLDEAIDAFPPGCVKISRATGEIDKSSLGASNTKRVTGVSIFADVDGFTKYIDDAAAVDENLVAAVRAYHVIRSEMRYVAIEDYGALRIQYQGDRMQALVFLPVDEDTSIAERAVELGAGLNASVVHTLPMVIGDAAKPLATGQAHGTALVSRLGEHGQPDVMCIGPGAVDAERFQLALDGGEIGISKTMRDLLPEALAGEFAWVAAKGCYVARDLTADKVDRLSQAQAIDEGKWSSVYVSKERGDTRGRPWQG